MRLHNYFYTVIFFFFECSLSIPTQSTDEVLDRVGNPYWQDEGQSCGGGVPKVFHMFRNITCAWPLPQL